MPSYSYCGSAHKIVSSYFIVPKRSRRIEPQRKELGAPVSSYPMRFTWLLVCSSDLAAEALVSRNISQLWGNPNMGSAQFYNPRLQQQQQFNSPSRQQGSDDSLPAGMPEFQLNRGVSQPPLNTQNDLLRQLISQRLQNPNGVRNTGAVAAAATGSNSILSAVAASASLQPNHPSNAGTGAASRPFSRNLRVGGTPSAM